MGVCCSSGPGGEAELVKDGVDRAVVAEEEQIVSATTIKKFAERVWPLLTNLAEGLMVNEVVPRVNKHLPTTFNISLRSFTIGKQPPSFGEMRIIETKKVMESTLDHSDRIRTALPFVWDSGQEMSCVVAGFHVGVNQIRFAGEIFADWGPILDDFPVLAGVAFAMPDPPKIDFHLTGVASIAELPPIRHAIFRALDGMVSSKMVLPKRIGIPAGRSFGVKPWLVTGPPPIGLIKVKVISASNLPSEDMGGDKSDPFVEVGVGLNTGNYATKVVKDHHAPVWNEVSHAFPVYTLFQKVHAHVIDKDWWTPNDAIGSVNNSYIHDLIQDGAPKDYALFKADGTAVPGATLKLAVEWRPIKPTDLVQEKLKAATDFPFVVSVLVDKVVGSPAQMDQLKDGFTVKVEIPFPDDPRKDFEFTSSWAKKEESHAETAIFRRILQNLQAEKMPKKKQAQITGLTEKQIDEIMKGDDVVTTPEFDIGIQDHVMLEAGEIQTKTLTFSIMKDGKVKESKEVLIGANIMKDTEPPKPVTLPSGTAIWCKLFLHSP